MKAILLFLAFVFCTSAHATIQVGPPPGQQAAPAPKVQQAPKKNVKKPPVKAKPKAKKNQNKVKGK